MIYFQPEYVKNFKCDGQRCGAQCCKHWVIDIDLETLDSYFAIESPAKELTSKIIYNEKRDGCVTKLDENSHCAFLGQDNLCTIQKNYGENFLSLICQTFPRHILKIADLYERSLNLTCPLAAEMALLNFPLNFELVEENVSYESKIGVQIPLNIDEKILPFVTEIQMTAIFILQTRTLTLDQRLATLGIYFKHLDEIISIGDIKKISDLTNICTSKNFSAQVSKFTFKPEEFTEFFIGKEFEDSEISLHDAANKFIVQSDNREKFIKNFSNILENYLVHEFFLNTYPFRVKGTIVHNYGIFVALYKIAEVYLFNLAKNENDIIKKIVKLSSIINHTPEYLQKILVSIEKFDDVGKIISTFLQTKGR